ncbi:hypothetical protein KR222_004166, partial [Zaprionus bogoriensis]
RAMNYINNNAAMERVCKDANTLFPELNVHINEISHPTEASITRLLVHYVRAFGYRVEPPYNIENEGSNSKEKRIFLGKLCRHVEQILQKSFPGKTYNTLDVLFNYLCFYKMHRTEVLAPIYSKSKQRENLLASIASKREQLEQRKKDAAQAKIDVGKCEASVNKLLEKLPNAQAECKEQLKQLRQHQAEQAVWEEQLTEIARQVEHFKQLVVLDGDVEVVKTEMKQITAQIENLKVEMGKQEQILMERRVEIESISKLVDEIDETMKILPPDVLGLYMEKLKLKERLEKGHAVLAAEHQTQLDAKEKSKLLLEQVELKLKARKVQFEQEAQLEQQKIIEEKENLARNMAQVEELNQRNSETQAKIEEKERTAEHLKVFVTKLFGNAKSF